MAFLQQDLRKLLNKLKTRAQLGSPPTNILKESNQQTQKARSPQPKAFTETPAPQAQIVQKPPEVVKSRTQTSEPKAASKTSLTVTNGPVIDKKTLTFGRGDSNSLQIGGNNEDLMELLRQKQEEIMNRNFVPKLNSYTEQQAIIEKSEEEDEANRSSPANSPQKDIPERFLSENKNSAAKETKLQKQPSPSENRYHNKEIQEQDEDDHEEYKIDDEEEEEYYRNVHEQREENGYDNYNENQGGSDNYHGHFEQALSNNMEIGNSVPKTIYSPYENDEYTGSPMQDNEYRNNMNGDRENGMGEGEYYKKMGLGGENYDNHYVDQGSERKSERQNIRNQELSHNYGEHYASSYRNDSLNSDGNEYPYQSAEKQSEYEDNRRDAEMSNGSPVINSYKKESRNLVRQSQPGSEGSYKIMNLDERKLSYGGSNYNEMNENSFNDSNGLSPISHKEIMGSKNFLLKGSEDRKNKHKYPPPSPSQVRDSIGSGKLLNDYQAKYSRKTPSRGNSPAASTGKKGSPVARIVINNHPSQKKISGVKESSPIAFEKTSKSAIPDEEAPREQTYHSEVPMNHHSPSRVSDPLPATRQPLIITTDLSTVHTVVGQSEINKLNVLPPQRNVYSKPFTIDGSGEGASVCISNAITPVASRGNLLESTNPQNSAKMVVNFDRTNMFSSPLNLRANNNNETLLGVNSAGVVGGSFTNGVSEYIAKKLSATDERTRHISSEHRASFNERIGTVASSYGNNFVYRFEDLGLKSKVNSTVTAKPSLDAFEVREFQKCLDLQRRIPEHVFEAILGDTALTRISKVYFCLKIEDFAIGEVDDKVFSNFYEFCDVKKDGFLDSNELGCSLEVLCEGKSFELNSVRMLFNKLDHEKKRYVDQNRMKEMLDSLDICEEDLERTKRAIADFFLEADKDKKGFLTYWDIYLHKGSLHLSKILKALKV